MSKTNIPTIDLICFFLSGSKFNPPFFMETHYLAQKTL